MSQSKSQSVQKTYSVLPDNRSALERALELSLSEQLYAVPHPYPDLLDAQNVSIDVVPYLAAERQLPVWDVSDSDEVKRNLAGSAWRVRCLSGTRAGLKLALDSLDFMSEIKVWHEQVPQAAPYSLEVIAWEQGNKPVNVDNVYKLLSYIEEVQSERDQVSLSLIYGVEFGIGLAGGISPGISLKEADGRADLWSMPEAELSLSVAAAVPPGVNICPLELRAVVPVIDGVADFGVVGSASHCSVSISMVSAVAV